MKSKQTLKVGLLILSLQMLWIGGYLLIKTPFSLVLLLIGLIINVELFKNEN